ncbi:MAG: hypothetical protein FWD83_09340 [Promicromonosporaceae bacterium]|nr:hypothetical protein [Promicromonosporaceae bacterium]
MSADAASYGHPLPRLTADDREWYAERAASEGGSRAILDLQIKSNVRARLGAAPSNFDRKHSPC